MRYLLLIAVAAATLAGCASQAQLAARDDARCQSYGFSPGKEGYAQCRMNLDMLRLQARQQAANAIAAGVAAGAERAQEIYSQPRTYTPPSPPAPSPVVPLCAEGYRCEGRTQQWDGTWR
jgi:hypothetical protein